MISSIKIFSWQDLDIDGNRLKADFNEICPMDHKMGFIFLYSLVCAALYPVHQYAHSEGAMSCVRLVGASQNHTVTPHISCSRPAMFD